MSVQLRPSRVLAKLRNGQVAYTFKLNLADVRAAEIAARAGFDCLWTCQEHVPNDLAVIHSQVLAAKTFDVDVICRVPRGSYSDYIRPLEMDAAGIMVPHVMSADDARQVVRMTRFHPQGLRALDSGNADGAYALAPLEDYLRHANEQRFIALQIEDPQAMDHLDEMARVDGFDILFFGAADFSHAIGRPGELDHPQVEQARREVAAVANKHGKFAGAMATPATYQRFIEMGYRLINLGADVIGLTNECNRIASEVGIQANHTPVGMYGQRP